jgi:predicted  nucleic acid-binding Zn-ribbon protein
MAESGSNREEQIIFRSKMFGGFEKRQVLSYIDHLRDESRRAEEQLNNHLSEMSEARGQLTAQISGFEEQLKAMERQFVQSQAKVKELTGVIEGLSTEISVQKQAVRDKEMELAKAREEKRMLEYTIDQQTFKSRKFDDLAMQIGTIIIEAKGEARDILDNANREAGQIKKEANETVELITEQVRQLRSGLSEARGSIQELLSALDSRLAEIETTISSTAILASVALPGPAGQVSGLKARMPVLTAEPHAEHEISHFSVWPEDKPDTVAFSLSGLPRWEESDVLGSDQNRSDPENG